MGKEGNLLSSVGKPNNNSGFSHTASVEALTIGNLLTF
jgi:hypothetical protein